MDSDPSVARELAAISQWQRDHERHDDQRFKQQQDAIGKLPTKKDMEEAVGKALIDFFKSYGNISYKAILVIATLIVALGVITGGFKWLLALLGFVKLSQ